MIQFLSLLKLFQIKKEERWLSFIALAVLLFFQYLIVAKFYPLFVDYTPEQWDIFMRNYHMSGFDPYLYKMVSDGDFCYDAIRHPLLAIFLYPFFLLNQLLWALTGVNCVQFIVGFMLIFCSFYSVLFLFRILKEQIVLSTYQSVILTTFFFGFAYVLVAIISADHFCLSLFCILMTLYIAGKKMQDRKIFSTMEIWALLILTAGITLTNGIIVVLAVWITHGRKFLTVKALLVNCVLPYVLLIAMAGLTDYLLTDGSNSYALDHSVTRQMTPTSIGASRMDIVIENFFGEGMQLHREQILGDVLVKRPVIVRYTWKAQYAVEAMIVVLFLFGAWRGRRSRLLWLYLSCFAFAVMLHIVAAFGINEVYIMTAHWAYVLPIAIGFLWKGIRKKESRFLTFLLLALTVYLWSYHGILLFNYLTWPLRV